MSAGLVTAICGAVIILGLAFKGGWLTRFAGAVSLVAFTLVVIQLGRAGSLDSLSDVGLGLWFVLAGGVLALIGGFFPTTRAVAATHRSEDTDTDTETTRTTHDTTPGVDPNEARTATRPFLRPGRGDPGPVAVTVRIVVGSELRGRPGFVTSSTVKRMLVFDRCRSRVNVHQPPAPVVQVTERPVGPKRPRTTAPATSACPPSCTGS